MKKIVYLAPALLLGLVGKGAMADQNTHISRLDAGFMTSLNESQPDRAANANKPNQEQAAQNKDVKTNKVKKTITTHISSLDSGIIEDNAKTNEIRHIAATNVNSLDNDTVENNTKVAQYGTFSVKANIKTAANFTESKVANGNSDQHTIRNPNNDQIIIHYVDEHGATIAGLKDQTIDINNAPNGNSTGQFKVPDNRYVLPDPTSDYQLQHDKHTIHHDAVWGTRTGTYWDGSYTVYNMNTGEEIEQFTPNPSHPGWYTDIIVPDQYDNLNGIPVREEPNLEQSDGEPYIVKEAYTETIGDNVFSDNSNNIKSVIGNTVNVILKHGTKNVDANNSDMELDSWRKVHVINSDNQNNLINESVKFKVGYTVDMVSLAKTANFNSSQALSNPNDFIGKNNLTDPVGFSAINTKLLSISL